MEAVVSAFYKSDKLSFRSLCISFNFFSFTFKGDDRLNPLTLQSAFGGLLRDLGRAVCRAQGTGGSFGEAGFQFLNGVLGQEEWAPVLDCVRGLPASGAADDLPPDSPAFCVALAEELSAPSGLHETADVPGQPLSAIFTHLNGHHPGWAVPAGPVNREFCPPEPQHALSPADYAAALAALLPVLQPLSPHDDWLGVLLSQLETRFSCFPAVLCRGEESDVSLYDHARTTAAIASCLSEYALANDIHDLRQLRQKRDEKVFLLYSADFSRIQKFIYTVHTSEALRSLRSRSFFLDLLMDHFLDELLAGCGLSRVNLIYSGGGRCYVLLPNTPAVIRTASEWGRQFNGWLREQFGTQLFLASAWAECSGNDLTNTPAARSPYKDLFRRVNGLLEQRKFCRYTAADLRQLNSPSAPEDGRECRVCGTRARLQGDRCFWCRLFAGFSPDIQTQAAFVFSRQASASDSCVLPALGGGQLFLSVTSREDTTRRWSNGESIARIYAKNDFSVLWPRCIRLCMGDYADSNSMEKLADAAVGIPRIAVCRMDVDDLGHAFISGFEQETETDPEKRMRYVTLSRTAAFSRQMSLFFKGHINSLLDGTDPLAKGEPKLQVAIVYAGGDDVFLVGAWNDVLEAAQRIQNCFTQFSCGALTLSAGIGIFDARHPIRLAADETAELEEAAKQQPGKNAVALFTPGRSALKAADGRVLVPAEQSHVYPWPVLRNEILGQKVCLLQRFFLNKDNGRGNAMLYNLLTLLREAEHDHINLARYAYLLARLKPGRDDPNRGVYEEFSRKMMDWGMDEEQRRQLITAIYIHVYQHRKVDNTNG